MKFENYLGSSIIFSVAIIFLIIGLAQYFSKGPVTFYTGEEPLPRYKYKDIKKWNHGHGIMWIAYSVIVILGAVISIIIGSDNVLILIPMMGSIIVPLPFLIVCHNMMVKKYIYK